MRVLVVRARAQAEGTARRLAAHDHQALLAPVLEIEPTGAPPPPVLPEALVVTSANAAPEAAAWHSRFGSLRVFAVGDRTGRALARAGYGRVVSAEGNGAALAHRIAGEVAPGATLLHLCGQDRNPEPGRSLLAAGFDVVHWEAYRAQAAARLPVAIAEALDGGGLDAALHFSRRSAEILTGLARDAGRGEALAALAHLCLSEEVAQGLAGLGPARVAVAASPSEEALLAALYQLESFAASRRARAAPGRGAREGTAPAIRPLRTAKDDRPR